MEFPYLISPHDAIKERLKNTNSTLTSILYDSPLKNLRVTAMEQDLCLVFTNAPGGEGYIWNEGIRGDRNDLLAHSDSMVKEVVNYCKNTIVIIHAIGPVTGTVF